MPSAFQENIDAVAHIPHEYREAAAIAHALFCEFNHIDGCSWEHYSDARGWDEDPWSRPGWLARVWKLSQQGKMGPGYVIGVMRDMHGAKKTADRDLRDFMEGN